MKAERKGDVKVIARSIMKMYLIDKTLGTLEDLAVNKAVKYIPNKKAQTAVNVAGIAAYFVLAMRLTKDEQEAINKAIANMKAEKSIEA